MFIKTKDRQDKNRKNTGSSYVGKENSMTRQSPISNPLDYKYELVNLANPPEQPMPDALGVEMTEPAIANLCELGNIDPQHGPDARTGAPAAIEACLECLIPPVNTRMLTIQADLDAIGGMAVLQLRSNGIRPGPDMLERINTVARSDGFIRDAWPGTRDLPQTVEEIIEDNDGMELAAMNSAMFGKISMEEKVNIAANWLHTGYIPEYWIKRATRPARELLKSIQQGKTIFSSHFGGAIASVTSRSKFALRQAYRLAPVVLSHDPERKFDSGASGNGYTIARWGERDANLNIAFEHLDRLEKGWGGQVGIKGSPQDRPSVLTPQVVLDCLYKALPEFSGPSI